MAYPAIGDRRERLEPDWHKPLIHYGSRNSEGLSAHPQLRTVLVVTPLMRLLEDVTFRSPWIDCDQ
jgi:hypothetical protein